MSEYIPRPPKTNLYTVSADTTTLYVTRRDGSKVKVLIDTQDLETVLHHYWGASQGKGGGYIIRTYIRSRQLLLNRFLNNTPQNKVCRFLDGDELNCRKANLRNCNRSEASANMRKVKRCKSGERNISWSKANQTWRIDFARQGQRFCKTVKSRKEATKVRDQYVREMGQEEAYGLNKKRRKV